MSPVQTSASTWRREEVLAISVVEQIQQATTPPSLPPTASMVPSGNSSVAIANASQDPAQSDYQGLSTGTKVGLAMVPVIIANVGLYILFLFWFRRRRIFRKTRADIPPAVPRKDLYSYSDSFDSGHRTSKIHTLNAFNTPIHDQNCQAQSYRKSFGRRDLLAIDKIGIAATNDMPAPPRSPHMVECGDSPIDGSSPFRLKRGDTVKRVSLGSDLARLWPSPPPSAWMKPPTTAEIIPPSVNPKRKSSRKEWNK